MNNRQGAKKLYKAHKTWIAAGVAAATLLGASAFGGQSVSAATTDTTPTVAVGGASTTKSQAQAHADYLAAKNEAAAK